MRMDVNAVLLQYFEQTAPPQTRAEAVLLAAAEALRTLLGAEEVRFVVRLGTLLKELTFPGQITRARTENEDDMILACLAHCAGKPVCVCAQNGGKAGNWLFPLPAEDGAVHGAALCSVLGIPEDAALAGAERLTRSLALRLPELFREKETVGISGASASEWEQAAMLSHEFKTPLTVVLSSLQLLRRRLCRPGKDIADGVEKYLDYAEQNLYKTLRLAANILDAQYADVKNVQAEEYTDLAAALAETVEGARPYAQTCGVTLRFENRSKGPCGLLCDTQRLDRIVLNLLSNALKHTPRGGAVFVLLERDGLYARIVVEDDGCGIPEQALPHLFEKFWRGQGERGGSGLGLYIAQQFARMQGGEIHAENRTERGARFIVELPVRLPGAETDVLSSVHFFWEGASPASVRMRRISSSSWYGFSRNQSAPCANAARAICSCPYALIAITFGRFGGGFSRNSLSRSTPSMLGITISRSKTSGCSVSSLASASSPSHAWPQQAISDSSSNASFSRSFWIGSSSAISTRIFAFSFIQPTHSSAPHGKRPARRMSSTIPRTAHGSTAFSHRKTRRRQVPSCVSQIARQDCVSRPPACSTVTETP